MIASRYDKGYPKSRQIIKTDTLCFLKARQVSVSLQMRQAGSEKYNNSYLFCSFSSTP